MQEIDPKRAADLLEKRPGLREVVLRFPEGRKSMMTDEKEGISTNINSSGKGDQRDPQADANMRLEALSETRSLEILALSQKDIQSAISRVKDIPLESTQIQTLTQLARQAAEKDPATARSVIGQAITILKGIKDPRLNAQAWAAIADAARLAKDEETARTRHRQGPLRLRRTL